jgi:hypothetical protein
MSPRLALRIALLVGLALPGPAAAREKIQSARESIGWYARHLRQAGGRYATMLLGRRAPRPTLEGVVGRVFGGDKARYERFVATLRADLPPGTRVVLWGSAATGRKFLTGVPFDAKGPGQSDLDVLLVGGKALARFGAGHFMIPRLASWPVSAAYPDIAPSLAKTRLELEKIAGRPVTLQAMSPLYLKATLQPTLEIR